MALSWALAIAVLPPTACSYDYSGLGGRPSQTGDGASGGSTTEIEKPDGSAGSDGNIDGTGVASGGRFGEIGAGGSGGTATGGTATGGTGTGGEGTAGVGGSVVTSTTGGAGGSAAGGADDEGGRGGGDGSGRVTVARTISIDFVGGTPMAVPASGGAGGKGGNGGRGGSAATTVLIAAPAMAPTEVAGVKPVARWNSAPGSIGTLDNLVQSDGGQSSASATWNSPSGTNATGVWKNRFPDAPGNVRMMNGYLDPTSSEAPATVLIRDLPADMATAGYDVYVYASGDFSTSTTRNYTYAIGASSVSVVQAGPTPATFSGFVLAPDGGMGNYIIFRNVTGAAFTLTARPPVGDLTRAPLNGMQIVSPPGS